MKNFDPMNFNQDPYLEQELRKLELRQLPKDWKARILPTLPPPWFPKPVMIFLALSCTASVILMMTTPKTEPSPLSPSIHRDRNFQVEFLLGSVQSDPPQPR